MKYYAVTEDPNELLHYGVKGMKWGQHIFGKERSPGYHRALGKLRASAKKVGSAIRNSSQQRAMAKEQKLQNKFAKAVAKTQKRIQISENLHNLSNLESYEKNLDAQYKASVKADKAAIKRAKKYAKNEPKMDKFMQEAREGRLKYGKLSDDQINRIRDRLAFENSARAVGGREKSKFRTRMKDALEEGMLQGVVQGTAAGMREIAVAKVQNRLANKKVLDKSAAQEAERQKLANRIKNKRTHKEMREDLSDEAYEAQLDAGVSTFSRNGWITAAGAAKAKQEAQSKLREQKRLMDIQDKINNEMDLINNEKYQKALLDQKERDFSIEEAHNYARNQRQNRENEERDERQFMLRAKSAYEYGYLPSGNNGGGGNKGNNQQNNNNKNKNKNGQKNLSVSYEPTEVERYAQLYKQKYIDKETNQQKLERLYNEGIAKQMEKIKNDERMRKRAADDLRKQQRERINNNVKNQIEASRKLSKNIHRVSSGVNGVTVDTLFTPYMQKNKRGYSSLKG